jgi:hypothetical protein
VLWRIFGPKREKVTERRRELNEKLDRASSVYGKDERYIQNFSLETLKGL